MKYFIITALVIILTSPPAFARLGEDETTISHRYGDPVKEIQIEKYDKKAFYRDKPYNLEITFKDGRAVIIRYQLDGEAKRMSLWRIEHILHSNAKKEGGWESIWYLSNKLGPPGQIHFFNQQRNATATYDLRDNTLMVRYDDVQGVGNNDKQQQKY